MTDIGTPEIRENQAFEARKSELFKVFNNQSLRTKQTMTGITVPVLDDLKYHFDSAVGMARKNGRPTAKVLQFSDLLMNKIDGTWQIALAESIFDELGAKARVGKHEFPLTTKNMVHIAESYSVPKIEETGEINLDEVKTAVGTFNGNPETLIVPTKIDGVSLWLCGPAAMGKGDRLQICLLVKV